MSMLLESGSLNDHTPTIPLNLGCPDRLVTSDSESCEHKSIVVIVTTITWLQAFGAHTPARCALTGAGDFTFQGSGRSECFDYAEYDILHGQGMIDNHAILTASYYNMIKATVVYEQGCPSWLNAFTCAVAGACLFTVLSRS